MARFAGLGLEPILADSDDDDGDIGFRRSGFGRTGADDGRKRGSGGGSDPMTDTWQNEVGNIKVNDRGMRVAQRDGQEEMLLEGQVVPDQLVFGDGRVIGRGACSVVNLAKHKDTGQLFAVKVFSLLDREKRRQLDREIGTLLRSLENGCCSQLVDFFGAFKRPDGSIRVVLEYMDRGSLTDVMDYRCAVQARWTERRDVQVKQEREAKQKRREAAEAATIAAAKAAAKAAARAAAKVVAKGLVKVSSVAAAVNGHASAARHERARGDGSKERAVPAPGVEEEDDDDDMPATFERLGAHPTPSLPAPHQHQQQQQKHQQKHRPNGVGRRDALDEYSSRNKGTAISNKSSSISGIRRNNSKNRNNNTKEEGTSAARKVRGEAGWILEEAYHSAPPQGTDSGLLPAGSRSVVKPPPLSAGACSTPSEAFLERGRGRVDAPWINFVDNTGDGGSSDSGTLRESSEDDGDEDFEAAERRRVDAAAELQRQKEQEEWDRAFEEELVQTGLPEDVVAACAYQILAGLTYLHEHNQLHRDVKPSNILLNAQGEVKLTDFGIARELDHAGAMVDTVVGTVRYMSPERLHGEAYGRPADVWGLGLVMIECVTQEAPYADGCSQIEILQTLKEHGGSGLLPTGAENRAPLSEAFVGFVEDCLKVNPEERLTTSQLLDSDWFVEQGIHGREEAVELMSEYLEGLYGPHAFKYFGDEGGLQTTPML